ncbi:Transketolase [Corynebacterium heidelbergense]|nr:transketolase [Corynebacterium heidelbergense]WCZ36569.1 Transketolase [Corynebacterium heidelbergense]
MTLSPELQALTVRKYPAQWSDLDTRAIDMTRVLAVDAVENCGSGHPGTAMSLAPLAYTLYQRVLRHNPKDTGWIGRDRFVLSCGHTSLTQYLQLYLGGFGLEIEDIKKLRTWDSLTPGHPEYAHTRGVEITTGPLGQGLASAVGMAMAARRERALFDPSAPAGQSPFDHHIFVIASDGDIEEGVTAEASSLAGTQQLDNLIVFWDDNGISIEDDTTIAFTEDVVARYAAYGWQTLDVTGEDVEGIMAAVETAKAETTRPTFIRMRSVIANPAPHAMNTGASHGAALGAAEVEAIKQELDFPNEPFPVDENALRHARQHLAARGEQLQAEWTESFDKWAAENPEKKELFDRLFSRTLPRDYAADLPVWEPGDSLATRKASEAVLQVLGKTLPELWGGSADLAGSTNTIIKGEDSFGPESISTSTFKASPLGRNLHFGIREHAMGAILNGIALHGPTRPYGATFLQFADYMRPSVRLGALMGVDTYLVWTHDSIALGEDGPTHQPVEHLAALRAIPDLAVLRPADANETAAAWVAALEADPAPKAFAFTRQNVPVLEGTKEKAREGIRRGAYTLVEASTGTPELILIATGSEVQIAVEAAQIMEDRGTPTRVVSMPVMEWFLQQDRAYRDEILPPSVTARVSIEAGIAMPWHQFTGFAGRNVSIERFGASADYHTLYEKFGMTTERVIAIIDDMMAAEA